MKGDRVEIVIDAGEGTRTYEVSATRAGRRVDISNRRGVIEVSEVTRTGTAVRTARFMASRVIALVEHPAGPPETEAGQSSSPGPPPRTVVS
jgi:hypothetical protein